MNKDQLEKILVSGKLANLRGADLSDANLNGSVGNRKQIKSIFIADEYPITYTFEYMQIGCQRHKIIDWWKFDDKKIIKMDGIRALKFWKEWRDIIKALIEKSPASE